ncbi:hypothetical protein ACVR1I_03945 [Streptococcus cameli]
MKFLTEDDLRLKYHQFPFDTFTVHKNQRLTPGARTFLLDRKIAIIDEREIQGKPGPFSKGKASSPPMKKDVDWANDSSWLEFRCELLQVAYDLAPFDLTVAQELTTLERCLSTLLAGGESVLPPFISNSELAESVDKNFIVGNLSNVGLFLQTEHGRVLTKVYPLYFHLMNQLNDLELSSDEKLTEILNRIGLLIAHYLQKREEVSHDVTSAT